MSGGIFLSDMHTVEHIRIEFFETSLADRTLYSQLKSDGKKDIVKKARKKLEEILSSHVPMPIDKKIDDQIRSEFPEIKI